jgi:hypothetical protein
MLNERLSLVLGAAASRNVSYEYRADVHMPSPLDSDFFDLLQRLPNLSNGNDQMAINEVLKAARALSYDCWRSFERAFYTLHLHALMAAKLDVPIPNQEPESRVVERFIRVLQVLLRAAHGEHSCHHHNWLFKRMGSDDAIISFSYDFVAERALGACAEDRGITDFGPWAYGLEHPL